MKWAANVAHESAKFQIRGQIFFFLNRGWKHSEEWKIILKWFHISGRFPDYDLSRRTAFVGALGLERRSHRLIFHWILCVNSCNMPLVIINIAMFPNLQHIQMNIPFSWMLPFVIFVRPSTLMFHILIFYFLIGCNTLVLVILSINNTRRSSETSAHAQGLGR